MYCLFDKVMSRYVMQGLRKLSDLQIPTADEEIALKFFFNEANNHIFYVVPATKNTLTRMYPSSRYQSLINLFLNQVDVAYPLKYHKRWARRLRKYTFTREDASVLSLATFGSNHDVTKLGMKCILTFDNKMINNWELHYPTIGERLETMKRDLAEPYSNVTLPRVLRPDAL